MLLLLGLPLGCTSLAPPETRAPGTDIAPTSRSADPASVTESETIQQVGHEEQAAAEPPAKGSRQAAGTSADTLPEPKPLPASSAKEATGDGLFAGSKELSVEALVGQVLARNPTLTQMVAAWEAAQARYPQAISLDDPLLQGGVTPSIFGGEHLHGGWQATLSQKYPWPGKLRLRGERTLAEARAAANDVDDVRLRLIESARIAFYDYYLVHRALAVNDEALRLLEDFRRDAKARYVPARGGQEDILLAEIELGRTRERRLLLEQARQIAVARLNTLLNLPPDAPLPRPPEAIGVVDGLPPVEQLRGVAVSRRPELQALANRIQAQQAALGLALKEYCPDFDLLATYNTLWQPALQQPLLGVRMNLPVRLAKRDAAVREVKALIVQLRAELADQTNQVNFQVQQAYAQVEQGKKAVRLYEQSVLRAAQLNVKSTRPAYVTGKVPFLTLIEAEREVIKVRDRYYELIAEYYRRLATLDRVIGGPSGPGGAAAGSTTSPASCRNGR